MPSGFLTIDSGDSNGLALFADLTGKVDMWLTDDSGDASGVTLRSAEADPNFPEEDEVILDIVYGYNDEYTGTFNGSGGLVVPTIEAEDNKDGESCTVTITDSDPAAVNTIQISPFGQQGAFAWTDYSSITGDGAATVTIRRGLFVCRVKSAKDGGAVYGIGNMFWITGARIPTP